MPAPASSPFRSAGSRAGPQSGRWKCVCELSHTSSSSAARPALLSLLAPVQGRPTGARTSRRAAIGPHAATRPPATAAQPTPAPPPNVPNSPLQPRLRTCRTSLPKVAPILSAPFPKIAPPESISTEGRPRSELPSVIPPSARDEPEDCASVPLSPCARSRRTNPRSKGPLHRRHITRNYSQRSVRSIPIRAAIRQNSGSPSSMATIRSPHRRTDGMCTVPTHQSALERTATSPRCHQKLLSEKRLLHPDHRTMLR